MSRREVRLAVHPGEILADELHELGIAPTALARQLAVPPNRIAQKRSTTGDTALRLGHWFGISPQFWLNLQTAYDIRVAQRMPALRSRNSRPELRLPPSADVVRGFGARTSCRT
jgi:antitoxin HigA-1